MNKLFKFRKNINAIGRIGRLVLGIALLIYAYIKMSWIALIFALFLFFEAAMSWCVIYHLLGKNSCSNNKCSK